MSEENNFPENKNSQFDYNWAQVVEQIKKQRTDNRNFVFLYDDPATDFIASTSAYAEVANTLKIACYDCHSSNTNYPWYTAIQPVGWWLNHHVDEGKEELNFSEYESYSLKRKLRKLKEIKEQIQENEMPMSSYTIMHSSAKLSPEQKELLVKWTEETAKYLTDTISHKAKVAL